MMMSTTVLVRRASHAAARGVAARRLSTTVRSGGSSSAAVYLAAGVVAMGVATAVASIPAPSRLEKIPTSGDVFMLGPTKEKATGILFPQLCNGMTLVGTGVRVKWGLIKVYAVGTYMDPLAMAGIKSQSDEIVEKALLDPTVPRTVRIVMARGLSIEKYTGAIVEALEPRMKGEDLEKLDEFKKLNPPVDLVEGAEIEMTIRGDTLLYRSATGGVGSITSAVFCRAMCDVYYGTDAVSPTHKASVVEGIRKMK